MSTNVTLLLLLLGAFLGLLIVEGILGSIRGIWAPVQQPIQSSGTSGSLFTTTLLLMAMLLIGIVLTDLGGLKKSLSEKPVSKVIKFSPVLITSDSSLRVVSIQNKDVKDDDINIHGIVYDNTGNPIDDVEVSIFGNNVTKTDSYGNFFFVLSKELRSRISLWIDFNKNGYLSYSTKYYFESEEKMRVFLNKIKN